MQKYSPYPLSFDEVTDFKHLYKAYTVARLSKRHKGQIIDFEMNLTQNLTLLEKRLKEGSYKIGKYKKFYIYEPKEREIQALQFTDRVVQHSICDNYLTPYYSSRMIYANCACQVGKGTRFARMLLKKYLSQHYKKYGNQGYFLKCDIKKYFANIDHQILKNIINKLPDMRLNQLLSDMIDDFNKGEGKGLPIGNQTSQIFGVMYLDSLDRIIKERFQVKSYVRYMDDLVLICKNRSKLNEILLFLREKIKDFKLEFNTKTQIIPLKNGIEFLGGRYYLCKNGKVVLKLKKQAKFRFYRNLRHIQEFKQEDKLKQDYLNGFYAGYHGFLRDFDSYYLERKMKTIMY